MGSYPPSSFTDSFAAFEALVSSLQTDEMAGSSHVDVETHINDTGSP
ncbi:MAG: hypothetical protein R3F61_20010 [Myxococcota bacterium]